MRRPLRSRIWFYKPWPGYLKPGPDSYLPKWWWVPVGRGGDEFNWHTITFGTPPTGMMIIATRRCTGTDNEDCIEQKALFPKEFERDWPIDSYGHNHLGLCSNPDCYCKDDDDG